MLLVRITLSFHCTPMRCYLFGLLLVCISHSKMIEVDRAGNINQRLSSRRDWKEKKMKKETRPETGQLWIVELLYDAVIVRCNLLLLCAAICCYCALQFAVIMRCNLLLLYTATCCYCALQFAVIVHCNLLLLCTATCCYCALQLAVIVRCSLLLMCAAACF